MKRKETTTRRPAGAGLRRLRQRRILTSKLPLSYQHNDQRRFAPTTGNKKPDPLETFTGFRTAAVDIVNTLSAAQATNSLPKALKTYVAPRLLLIDELGYLPMDKRGADLLFQVISARYERGAIIITTNTAYKQWPRVFNNDATITTAILDRLLHHCETITIEGKSYRMKDKTYSKGERSSGEIRNFHGGVHIKASKAVCGALRGFYHAV